VAAAQGGQVCSLAVVAEEQYELRELLARVLAEGEEQGHGWAEAEDQKAPYCR
jgi:hypothetical protein